MSVYIRKACCLTAAVLCTASQRRC